MNLNFALLIIAMLHCFQYLITGCLINHYTVL